MLEALLGEIEGQIESLEERRDRLQELLSKEDPEEYRTVLALTERIASLAELPEEVQHGPDWTADPMGNVFFELMTPSTFPAQRRFFELCQERLPVPEEGDTG